MPTVVQLQGVNYDVQEMAAVDEEKKPLKLRVLILEDPTTGVRYNVPFPESDADDLGDLLKGQKRPDLEIASADQMPKPGEPGPGQRPPQAGKGRPGR